MGRHLIPAPDPVRQLLIGEVQSPQFREMVDSHSPLLMRLIRASIAFHDMEHKAIAEAAGYKARHIRRFLNGELAKTDEYYELAWKMVIASRLAAFLSVMYGAESGQQIQDEVLPIVRHVAGLSKYSYNIEQKDASK